MYIPYKIIKNREIISQKTYDYHQSLAKYLSKTQKKQKPDTINYNSQFHNKTLPSYTKEKIFKWLFSLDLKNRIKVCSIYNTWLTKIIFQMLTYVEYENNVQFRPTNLLEIFYTETHPYAFQSQSENELQENCNLNYLSLYFKGESTTSFFKNAFYKNQYREKEFLKEIRFLSLNEYNDTLTLSIDLLSKKEKLQEFFDCFSGCKIFTKNITTIKNKNNYNNILNFDLPNWRAEHEVYTIHQLLVMFFEQIISIHYQISISNNEIPQFEIDSKLEDLLQKNLSLENFLAQETNKDNENQEKFFNLDKIIDKIKSSENLIKIYDDMIENVYNEAFNRNMSQFYFGEDCKYSEAEKCTKSLKEAYKKNISNFVNMISFIEPSIVFKTGNIVYSYVYEQICLFYEDKNINELMMDVNIVIKKKTRKKKNKTKKEIGKEDNNKIENEGSSVITNDIKKENNIREKNIIYDENNKSKNENDVIKENVNDLNNDIKDIKLEILNENNNSEIENKNKVEENHINLVNENKISYITNDEYTINNSSDEELCDNTNKDNSITEESIYWKANKDENDKNNKDNKGIYEFPQEFSEDKIEDITTNPLGYYSFNSNNNNNINRAIKNEIMIEMKDLNEHGKEINKTENKIDLDNNFIDNNEKKDEKINEEISQMDLLEELMKDDHKENTHKKRKKRRKKKKNEKKEDLKITEEKNNKNVNEENKVETNLVTNEVKEIKENNEIKEIKDDKEIKEVKNNDNVEKINKKKNKEFFLFPVNQNSSNSHAKKKRKKNKQNKNALQQQITNSDYSNENENESITQSSNKEISQFKTEEKEKEKENENNNKTQKENKCNKNEEIKNENTNKNILMQTSETNIEFIKPKENPTNNNNNNQLTTLNSQEISTTIPNNNSNNNLIINNYIFIDKSRIDPPFSTFPSLTSSSSIYNIFRPISPFNTDFFIYSKLDKEIYLYEETIKNNLNILKPYREEIKNKIISCINDILKTNYYEYELVYYGSYVTKLSIESSDIDILIKFKLLNENDINNNNHVENIIALLEKNLTLNKKKCDINQINAIYTASVPVLKIECDLANIIPDDIKASMKEKYKFNFDEEILKLNFDFTFLEDINNNTAIIPSREIISFIQNALQNNLQIKPIILVLKRYMQINKLNSSFNGGISSMSLFLLVFAFIKFNIINFFGNSIGKTLYDFFMFYNNFNFRFYSIDIQSENPFLFTELHTGMILIDPITRLNVSKSTYRVDEIKFAFTKAAIVINNIISMGGIMENEEITFLGELFKHKNNGDNGFGFKGNHI